MMKKRHLLRERQREIQTDSRETYRKKENPSKDRDRDAVMQPQAKELLEPPQIDSRKESPLEALERVWLCKNLDFGLLAFRTMSE